MSRQVTGYFFDPVGEPLKGTLEFIAKALDNSSDVMKGSRFKTALDQAGVYDVTLVNGKYDVFMQHPNQDPLLLGAITITDGVAIALDTLLAAAAVAGNDLSLTDLSEIDLTGLSDGDMLIWNAGAGKFQPGTPGGSTAWHQRGAYNPVTVYAVNDLVRYSNGLYIRVNSPGSGDTPTNPTYWELLVQGV